MPKLKFVDLKTKKTFTTDDFEVLEKNGRRFARTKSPSGSTSQRFVAKDFKK